MRMPSAKILLMLIKTSIFLTIITHTECKSYTFMFYFSASLAGQPMRLVHFSKFF